MSSPLGHAEPHAAEQTTLDKPLIVWTIAGSDSGGGAGIQADLQTFRSLGVHGCSVITSVTAQNSLAALHAEAVSTTLLDAQLKALSDDLPPAIIKIGLLANPEQVKRVATCIQQLRKQYIGLRVIYDPVIATSTGFKLMEQTITDCVKTHLLPQLDLITPNAQEVEALTGIAITNFSSLKTAAWQLLNSGCGAVLIKGGHHNLVASHCMDYLLGKGGESHTREVVLAQPRLDTTNGHGSGCCLASAIAAVLAHDYPLADAVIIANAYVHRGIRTAQSLGAGPGPVAHGPWPEASGDFPQRVLPGSLLAQKLGWCSDAPYATGFATCETNSLGLYPVVDSNDWLEKLLQLGVRTLQLRIKDAPYDDLRQMIAQAVALGEKYKARIFINDYWRLAIEIGAYGVHLGQDDLETADLAAIRRAGLRLGISTHGYCELLRALALVPSYIAVGAIYATATKDMPSKPQGLKKLARYLQLAEGYPVVAIGGITVERAAEVSATGVGSLAVVTGITQAADYRSAVADYNVQLQKRHV